jgi:hypothetical protein
MRSCFVPPTKSYNNLPTGLLPKCKTPIDVTAPAPEMFAPSTAMKKY